MAALVEVQNVSKRFTARSLAGRRTVQAVTGVSLAISAGQTCGIVGESGSGKSTLGRIVAGLESTSEGQLVYDGTPYAALSRELKKRFRRSVQVIFQDPVAALNPRLNVGQLLAEPFYIQDRAVYQNRNQLRERIEQLMAQVELDPELATRYPRELSGGQCQRICIARAFALQPQILVCDESLSALDVSVQKKIVGLLRELQQKSNVAYLFITHDLRLAEWICDEIYVMHKGQIVDAGSTEYVLYQSTDPYVQQLRNAVLQIGENRFLSEKEYCDD